MQTKSQGSGKKKSFPVRLRLHYSWILAFILIIAVVTTQFPEAYSFWRRLLIGAIAACIFLLLLIIKQVVINYIARSRDAVFRRVTLYVFGGVPGITRESTSPLLDILLGSVGLVLSIIITGFLYLIYVALVLGGSELWGGIISWLAFIFSLLTIFHILPGFPLDGGRILRGLLWRATGDYDTATGISTWVGRGLGLACIVGGIVVLYLEQQWFLGITLVFVGLFLFIAADRIHRITNMRRILRNTRVIDVMTREYPHIAPQMSVARIIEDYCLLTGQYYFLVVSEDRLLGSVALKNIRLVPRRLRGNVTAASIMMPAEQLISALPDQSSADVLEQMLAMDFDEIPVIEDNRVVGAVFQDKLTHLARIKSELRI